MKALSLWHGVIEIPDGCTMAEICRWVADERGVSVDALKGPGRTQALAHARQEAMWLMRKLTRHSSPRIGQFLGGRDHSTVLHGALAHEARARDLSSHLLSDINTSSTSLNPPNPAGVALVP